MVLQFTKDNRLFAPELNNLAYQLRTAVKTGCEVTESAVPAMSVDVAAGSIFFNGQTIAVTGATGLVITAADPNFDRIDLVLLNSSGVASVLTGTAAATPKAPTYDPDLFLCIARVFVNDSATQIVNADITDQRIISSGTGGGGVIIKGAAQAGCADGDAVRFDGSNFVPAQADTIPNAKVIGFINNIVGTTGDVTLFGEIDYFSGLTPGDTYYLDETTAGAITNVRPAIPIRVGIATGTTSLAIDIDQEFSPGGGSYTQAFNGINITVTHNLSDVNPLVQVYDNLGKQIIPDTVDIIDANNVQLTFTITTQGTAVVHSLKAASASFGTSSVYQQTFTTATNVVVSHNLNQQYVVVQAYDNNNQLIEPQSVTLDNANQCTVTFGVATTGKIVVVGGATFVSAGGSSSLIPNSHDTFDIGSNAARWANLYLSQDADIDGDVNIAGKLTVNGGVDPSYIQLDPQVSEPDNTRNNKFWVDSSDGNRLKFKNNNSTNTYVQITESLSAQQYGYVLIPSMAPDENNSPTQGYVGLCPSLNYADGVDTYALYQFQTPEDFDDTQPIQLQIVFCMDGTNSSNNVVLQVEANAIANGEDGAPMIVESTLSEIITVPNTAKEVKFITLSTAIIPASILSGAQVVSFRLGRLGTNSSDDATTTFQLLNIRARYTRK